MRTLKIGLLGCGTVGSGLVRLLEANASLIHRRAEAELSVSTILVRDLMKDRPGIDRSLLTDRPERVLDNGADIIVELLGGIEPARSFIRDAIGSGKHVVTANKCVLALAGDSLTELAAAHRVTLGYEASVCGAIPIIRVIRDGLAGHRIRSITGILNGTSNFILTKMSEDGTSFADALQQAQSEGFAEADPSADVEGQDAAQKITILARLAFGDLPLRWIERDGIRNVTPAQIALARQRGQVIRHIVEARCSGGKVAVSAIPRALPREHALASVRGESNGVVIESDSAGKLFFHGAGAGSLPSAGAVLSDIIDICRSPM